MTYFPDGSPFEKAFYDSQDSMTSRLLSLEAWSQPGVKCPHSHIDEEGSGERRSYNDDGSLAYIMHIDRHELKTDIFYYKKGRIEEVWAHEKSGKKKTWMAS